MRPFHTSVLGSRPREPFRPFKTPTVDGEHVSLNEPLADATVRMTPVSMPIGKDSVNTRVPRQTAGSPGEGFRTAAVPDCGTDRGGYK